MRKLTWLLIAILTIILPFELLLAAKTSPQNILFEGESPYQTIYVIDKGNVRYFSAGKQDFYNGAIYLSSPYYHFFEYSQLMLFSLAYMEEQPKEVLVIGLGAGIIPKYLRKYYPNLKIDIVELDPMIVTTAKKYFDFKLDDKMRLFVKDGRRFIRKTKKKYDIIFLDAFHGGYIPFHLMTKEFLTLVKSRVKKTGVVVSNTWQISRLFERESVTYKEVFGHFDAYDGSIDRNRIIIGSVNGKILSRKKIETWVQNLQSKKQFEELDLNNIFLKTYKGFSVPNPKAEPLTDDFAPVNTLLGAK
jgi:spermidine synthase